MLAARMYEHKQPLVLEDIKIPEITPDQVLVRVGAAGLRRSEARLIDGYLRSALPGVRYGFGTQFYSKTQGDGAAYVLQDDCH